MFAAALRLLATNQTGTPIEICLVNFTIAINFPFSVVNFTQFNVRLIGYILIIIKLMSLDTNKSYLVQLIIQTTMMDSPDQLLHTHTHTTTTLDFPRNYSIVTSYI